MSRRRFIQYGLSSLAVAPFTTWSHGDAASSSQPLSTDSIKLGTGLDIANRLTVPVHINGQGPFNFVVDTGAERTVVCDEVATALGLTRGASVLIHGISKNLVSETVSIAKLSLGSITRSHLQLPTLSRALLQCDGFLGMDILDGNRVIFDFEKQTLTVTRPRSISMQSPIQSHEARIDLQGKSGRLRSGDCKIDGVRATAFIDSGAEVSAGNSSLHNALIKKNPARDSGMVTVFGVTGGQQQGHVTSVSNIHLQDITFSNCALVIADFEVFSVWGLNNTPALLIGMNYLRQFSQVSIDYGRGELRFELSNRRPAADCQCTTPKV